MLTVHTSYRSGSLDIDYRAHQSDLRKLELSGLPALVLNKTTAALNLQRLPENCGFVTLLVHSQNAGSLIALVAENLHVKISSGKTAVCEFKNVSLDTHVDWFCLGVFVRIAGRWAFKEVLSFPDHRGQIDEQLIELLTAVKHEISEPLKLDDSFTFLDFDHSGPPPVPARLVETPVAQTAVLQRAPSPLKIAVPGSVVRSVKTAVKSGGASVSSFASPRSPPANAVVPPHPRALPKLMDVRTPMYAHAESGVGVSTDSLGQLDFFMNHNREVKTLQHQLERLELEIAKYRAKEKFGPTVLSAAEPRRLTQGKPTCEKCATSEAELVNLKERLVELEAGAVLSELMGGSNKAEVLIVQEDNRALRLRCAELEGKCAVQERMIEELKGVKRQLVQSITKIPKISGRTTAIPEVNENHDEDPVVHHIRVQERLIAALKEQLDILATQMTIGQALMGEVVTHDDELL